MRLRITGDKVYVFGYFILVITLGSLLLMLPASWHGDSPLSPVDALFTATSAVCVTGLTSVDTTLYSRFGQSVIAVLIQLGGLGLVSFALVYVATPRARISLVSSGLIRDLSVDDVESNPRRIIILIVGATLVFEALGALVLYPRFLRTGSESPLFEAVFHSISAFCNAGFSTRADNLEGFLLDPWVSLTVMILLVVGGIGFTVLQDAASLITRKRRRLHYHSMVVLGTSLALILIAMAFYYIVEYDGAYATLRPPQKLLAAAFQSVTPRTAGFDTIPQAALGSASVAFTILLMFIGASPGSTGGGIKTTTLFIVLAAAFKNPERDSSIPMAGRQLDATVFMRAFAVLIKAALIVFVSWCMLLLVETAALKQGRLSSVELLFESVSGFATVGLSLGATLKIGTAAKLVLVATMFAGRIGLFAMAMPRSEKAIERWADYPRASLMIG